MPLSAACVVTTLIRDGNKTDMTLKITIAIILPILLTAQFDKRYTTPALVGIMLAPGLSLTLADFGAVFTRQPHLLALGMTLQYSVLPAIGFVISRCAHAPAYAHLHCVALLLSEFVHLAIWQLAWASLAALWQVQLRRQWPRVAWLVNNRSLITII